MIRLRQLKKSFGGVRAVDIDALDIPAGAISAIVGDNGCGKTTLLRILAGLLAPDSGTVEHDLYPVSLVFQKPLLFRGTVRHNLAYPLRLKKTPADDRRRLVDQMMERFAISHLAQAPADQLSGGETQKVSLARALLTSPKLLLLDEPTASIDESSLALMEQQILDYHAKHRATIIWVTHQRDQARQLAHHIFEMKAGRI